ncbi:MAG TPA: sigma-70 family RNA polymerase sigma factor, partial [Candidatus Acidoferrum sp.]|nr:sigma-70 family RNA polymerase sigma factor [Candidatus Acidoferrum sp.]
EWNTGYMEFEALANQHKDEVYRQMIRACGNREDAEDVLVEALLKAYKHLDQLRDVATFRAWLAQIARRVCWQLKQREALHPLLQLSMVEEEGHEIPSGEPPLEQQIALRQMSTLLHEAVDKLGEEYHNVYVWRDLEDVPAKEVAERLGITVAAVKSRLHRARESVRNALDAALVQPPGAKKL